MEILGYGEDALTLWALKNKLPLILSALNDSSSLSQCKAFFRPSFGRRGGPSSAQFGEFDFILLIFRSLFPSFASGHCSFRPRTLLRVRLRRSTVACALLCLAAAGGTFVATYTIPMGKGSTPTTGPLPLGDWTRA